MAPAIFEARSSEHDQVLITVDIAVLQEAREIGYSKKKIGRFKKGADAHLIAQAILIGGCVVTEESRRSKGKIQIPQICERMGVQWTNTLGMMDRLGAQYSSLPRTLLRVASKSTSNSF